MPQLRPIKDFIVLEIPEDRKSLIARPQTHDPLKMGTSELVVILVGPKCKYVKPGDRLIFDPGLAITMAHEGKQYFLITEFAVGCIIRQKKSRSWLSWLPSFAY